MRTRAEELVRVPLRGGARGDEVLGENVERLRRDDESVHCAGTDSANERRTFEQLVARRCEDDAFGFGADPMPGSSDTLQRHAEGARRADLHHEFDTADVDAEFERCGRDYGAQFAPLETVLGRKTRLFRQAAVMRNDGPSPKRSFNAKATRSLMRRVPNEDQRRAMFGDKLRDAIIGLGPHLVAGYCSEFVVRHVDSQFHLATAADVDDFGGRAQETRDVFERTNGRGKSHALRFLSGCSSTSRSSRASVSARCEPRLSLATAWISSTITVETFENSGATSPR